MLRVSLVSHAALETNGMNLSSKACGTTWAAPYEKGAFGFRYTP